MNEGPHQEAMFHDGYDLYDGTPPHVRASDTSAAAAESQRDHVARKAAAVLALFSGGRELTCDECERLLGWSHQTVSARVRELVLKHKLKDTGRRRKTRTGRGARIYARIDGEA